MDPIADLDSVAEGRRQKKEKGTWQGSGKSRCGEGGAGGTVASTVLLASSFPYSAFALFRPAEGRGRKKRPERARHAKGSVGMCGS